MREVDFEKLLILVESRTTYQDTRNNISTMLMVRRVISGMCAAC